MTAIVAAAQLRPGKPHSQHFVYARALANEGCVKTTHVPPASGARGISHAYFFLIGLVGVGLLPALIRSFEVNFSLSHTQMGAILSASSLVMAAGSVLSGVWYDRAGPRWVLGAALAVTAAGALMVWGAASAAAFALALMLFHFGHGLGVPVNSLISQLYGSERGRGLILMHGFQALGRLGAPALLLVLFALSGGWRSAFLLSAILFGTWAALFVYSLQNFAVHAERSAAGGGARAVLHYLADARLQTGLLGFVSASGVEGVLMTWLPTYLQTEGRASQTGALLALSAMLIGYTVIRLLLGTGRLTASARFIGASVVAFLAGLALVLSLPAQLYVLYPACVLLGAAVGAFWPALATRLYECFPNAQGIIGGLIVSASVLGGASTVTLVGWIGDAFSLQQALLIMPVCAVAYWWLYRSLALRMA